MSDIDITKMLVDRDMDQIQISTPGIRSQIRKQFTYHYNALKNGKYADVYDYYRKHAS